jgi:hypothetical protein
MIGEGKDTENLMDLVSELKKEKEFCNDKLKKISVVIYELEKYTGQQSVQILEHLKNKEAKYKIVFGEMRQVFDKNMQQFVITVNALVDEKLGKINQCLKKLLRFKDALGKQMNECINELQLKDAMLFEMTRHASTLEKQLQKPGKPDFASLYSSKLSDLNPDHLDNTKLHHQKCIALLQDISNLDMDITDFTDYKIKIDDLIDSKLI